MYQISKSTIEQSSILGEIGPSLTRNYKSHYFNPEVAKLYGVNEAIIINNFQYWIEENRKTGINFHDDKTWTYNSSRVLAEQLSYFSEDQIDRLIKSLVSKGVLVVGNYNKKAYDRTRWYAFKDESLFLVMSESLPQKRGMDAAKVRNGCRESAEPIPYNNPYKRTDNSLLSDSCKSNGLDIGDEKKTALNYSNKQIITKECNEVMAWIEQGINKGSLYNLDNWEFRLTNEECQLLVDEYGKERVMFLLKEISLFAIDTDQVHDIPQHVLEYLEEPGYEDKGPSFWLYMGIHGFEDYFRWREYKEYTNALKELKLNRIGEQKYMITMKMWKRMGMPGRESVIAFPDKHRLTTVENYYKLSA